MHADPENAADFVPAYTADAARLTAAHAYDPADEHDACGVGLIAAVDGKPSRRVVDMGIEALKALWHRGAVDADGKTGDGAGIHLQIPQEFFKEHIRRQGHTPKDGRIGVGMVFMPRTELEAQERCRVIVEQEILSYGHAIYGWRQVPVNIDVIGEKANATRPEIEQVLVNNARGVSEAQFEIDLFIIRRRIEKRALAENLTELYFCSFSCRSLIYKGMFLAEQLGTFYPDLLDQRFVSNFAIYHQRYSTNTFPQWRLAQPFRVIAHNGEINTLRGNVNWMKSHETRLGHGLFGEYVEDVKPIVQPGGSDSAALDNVFEMLVRTHRTLPMAKVLLIPEAWENDPTMPESLKNLYNYANSVMEPWDGPAAICGFGGRWALAGMDRNGLRPLRYSVLRDASGEFLVAGSETGMVVLEEGDVIEKGRLGPGQMIGVDLKEGRLVHDAELKAELASSKPFGDWVRNVVRMPDLFAAARPVIGQTSAEAEPVLFDRESLRRRLYAAGFSLEDMEAILQPMAEEAKEAIGSMGDDTPLAVLSEHYRGLHHFFRQNFSQVTNPPIDSLRERRVMSLRTRIGNLGNILEEDEAQLRIIELDSPFLTTAQFLALRQFMGDATHEIDCTFAIPASGHAEETALRDTLRRIQREAEDAVRRGAAFIVLTDEHQQPGRCAVPMILATGAVHTHLVRQQLRTYTSVNVRVAECLDVHTVAVLIGVGATTVNAYLALEAIADRHRRGLFGTLDGQSCVGNYVKSINDGLLKVMSKMGISIISSYRGGYNFEAVGLSRSLVAEFFPGMSSRLSGIGLSGIQRKVTDLAQHAFGTEAVTLPIGGIYKFRRTGEVHANEARSIHMLQSAVATDSYTTFKRYSDSLRAMPPINLRDLLDLKPAGAQIAVDEVESITEIRKRFITPGMSLGALSPEAHGTLNIAMNRIGARSVSGEGGEDRSRYKPYANGDNANSAVKQVASGRFGVTAEYLNQCRELEIKMAQGAKPGEGGQLPGFKVTEEIARLRHATPGVMLISPPPHHDIYSIEDLAQLIYDLKQINPDAKVAVKLVSRTGIGTIAAGVAKAKADIILISGHSGGTGASPQTSIKYAGLPWEMGLSEAHQVLTLNRLRNSVVLRTDGGLKTGRDIVIAAMLGAEEFGIGTASLIAMGCIMVRQCHSNTCPVGVCTQDKALRERFSGTPEKVVNLFSFLAEEVREILASLGVRSLAELVGRTDLLRQVSRGSPHLDDLDLNPLLVMPDTGGRARHSTLKGRNEVPDSLDAQMLNDAKPLFEKGEKMQLAYTVRNVHRAVGTRISSHLVRQFGMDGLPPDHLTIRLRGSAGQSLGAFAVRGLKIEVFGDSNDYVGKGLSGATIVVRPRTKSGLRTDLNTIVGNTVLYGATSGKLFAAGQAGERYCVRNSGAIGVVEGCGSNGCEYMTGGMTAILGPIGYNFAAGMTGGMAFVYDPEERLPRAINPDTVIWQRIEVAHYDGLLRRLVEEHVQETGSRFAERLLVNWEFEQRNFWQVVPKEMLSRLEVPVTAAERARA